MQGRNKPSKSTISDYCSFPSCLSLMATWNRSSSRKSLLMGSVMAPVQASGAVVWRGLHTDDDLVLQGVRNFVASKQHLGVLQQLSEIQG